MTTFERNIGSGSNAFAVLARPSAVASLSAFTAASAVIGVHYPSTNGVLTSCAFVYFPVMPARCRGINGRGTRYLRAFDVRPSEHLYGVFT